MQRMIRRPGAMHVARIKSSHVDKAGQRRDYQSVYLRRSFRDGGKVKHEQLANLSALPDAAISAIEAVLAGAAMVPAADAVWIESSLPHGHVAAVTPWRTRWACPPCWGRRAGPATWRIALIMSRVLTPGLETVHAGLVGGHHPGGRSGGGRAATDEIYAAMDWLPDRQDDDRKEAGGKASGAAVNPCADRVVRPVQLVGDRAVLRAGRPRLLPRRQEGLRADRVRGAHRPGRPPGRDAGVRRQHRRPDRVHRRAAPSQTSSASSNMVLVGDRGMITSARIDRAQQTSAPLSAGSPRCAPPPSPNSPPTTGRCR